MRQGEAQHLARTGIKQSFFRFRHCGAGRDDIVYENDIGAGNFIRIGGSETSFKITQSFISVFEGSLAGQIFYFFKSIKA